jgi:hypothetical protein
MSSPLTDNTAAAVGSEDAAAAQTADAAGPSWTANRSRMLPLSANDYDHRASHSHDLCASHTGYPPEARSHHSLPVFKVLGEPRKNAIERALSIFADVRAGEGVTTLLLTLNVFLLLAGYSVMKPARDGLILTEGGAELASYSAAAQGACSWDSCRCTAGWARASSESGSSASSSHSSRRR